MVVTEIDPICALQAAMEGYQVVRVEDVLAEAEAYVTTTGCAQVITAEHMAAMRDQAIVCNIGHFDTEICVADLKDYPGVRRVPIKPQSLQQGQGVAPRRLKEPPTPRRGHPLPSRDGQGDLLKHGLR